MQPPRSFGFLGQTARVGRNTGDSFQGPVRQYCTADFVCEVLICTHYASCCKLANFNSVVTVAFSFQLTACVIYSSLLVIFYRMSIKIQREDISASP